jgi:ABC-type glycerol-3-phosphate transport system permease component
MNEWPKAVTTASIWISVGFALGYGLFRMQFTGDATLFLLFLLTAVLVGAAVGVTLAIWRSKPSGSEAPGSD